MDLETLKSLYRHMLMARRIDISEEQMCRRGEASFHLSGAGHEAVVGLAPLLNASDWLHCHYRSRSLLLARGVPVRAFFDNLLGKSGSGSQGRRMGPFFDSPQLNLLSMTTLVGNSALQCVGVATAVRDRENAPIVVCGTGDGTTQQGEYLEACGEAYRRQVPVLFLIEDNQLAISTRTDGKTFFNAPPGSTTFQGVPIVRVDGTRVWQVHDQLTEIVSRMRAERGPVIAVLSLERLVNHSNSDNQSVYRSDAEIRDAQQVADPLTLCHNYLVEQGVTERWFDDVAEEITELVAHAAHESLSGQEPAAEPSAKLQLPIDLVHPSREARGNGPPELTMREALCDVLGNHLQHNPRVHLLGQDIEDPKGDVFGVTRGLSTRFPDRVTNASLSESTIVGVSVGRALAGERPVAFIQFADFLPLAFNQIASELATMYWRTSGRWHTPVIIMAACGGYRPGLGPFHAQSAEGSFAHIPGIDIFMPSTATDAAGMLNAAFASSRPTLFLYPKALLNDPGIAAPRDVTQIFVPVGTANKVRAGRDITLVGWGNTVKVCEETSSKLEEVGIEAEVIDLRSISPWDERMVIASAERTARLLVVHEDNHSGGVGAEVIATVAERVRVPVTLRRVTRPDTHIPCHFSNQMDLLPSMPRVLETAAEMLDLDLTWQADPEEDAGFTTIKAIGSSPSDETVTIVELHVETGDSVQPGDVLASLEATKSIFELTAPVAGTIDALMAQEGDTLHVGEPLLRMACSQTRGTASGTNLAPMGQPHLKRRTTAPVRISIPRHEQPHRSYDVGLSSIATVEGQRVVMNEELLSSESRYRAADIVRRTGIEERRWVGPDQNAIGMAIDATRKVLDQENLILDDIDLLICSTTSPTSVTPSTACQVLNGLTRGRGETMMQAYDINAACSGYLYALQAGYDFLQSRPDGRVMVVTTEVLSPLLDRQDFDTAILFGDAASASILYGEAHVEHSMGKLHRPELSAKGDRGDVLSVPLLHDGFIQMQGRRVFHEAVRSMIASLRGVCDRQSMAIEQLKMIVPHQANQRILDAIQHRVAVEVCSNIRLHGNTSSSSIPLCLSEVLPRTNPGDPVGLCAFGGGFTFGACILEMAP